MWPASFDRTTSGRTMPVRHSSRSRAEGSMKVSRFVAVVLVGAFVLAGCGGGDETDTASPAAGDGGVGGAFDTAQCAQVVTAMSAAAAAVPAAMSGGAGDLSTSLAQL